MKHKWDRRYFQWGISAFLVIACSILFYYILFENHSVLKNLGRVIGILMPIIDGCIIAYLLRPIVNFIEKRPAAFVMKKLSIRGTGRQRKTLRLISILVTFIIAFLVLYTLLYMLIPQIFFSIQNLVTQLPTYFDNFQSWILSLLKDNPDFEATVSEVLNHYITTLESWMTKDFLPQLNDMIVRLSSGILSAFVVIKNFFLGCFVAIDILSSKDVLAGQFKKLFYALFPQKAAEQIIKVLHLIDANFSGFISGKLLDSLIIGLICFAYTSLMNTPYYILVSVVIGVTNIIPFFGPYIGAIPSILLILLVDPLQSLYFLIFIILLQTFDGNFLGPKILGNKTGLSSFLVLCSILIFGGLFGVVGMVISVPTTAVLYAGIRNFSDWSLRKKNLPTEVYHYMESNRKEQENAKEKEREHSDVKEPSKEGNRKEDEAL